MNKTFPIIVSYSIHRFINSNPLKMIKLSFCMLMIAILMTSMSCKKDKTEPVESSFSAKIDGSLWTAKTVVAVKYMNGITQISAAGNALSEQIALMFSGSGTGTYLFNETNVGSVANDSNSFSTFFVNHPEGKIIITEYDEVKGMISGTFEFEGEDIYGNKYILSEGKINKVNLTVQ